MMGKFTSVANDAQLIHEAAVSVHEARFALLIIGIVFAGLIGW